MKYKVKVRRVIIEEAVVEVTLPEPNVVQAMNYAEEVMRDFPDGYDVVTTTGLWSPASVKEEKE